MSTGVSSSGNIGKSNGMSAMDDNKSKALAAALAQIEKQFGKGSIMRLGQKGVVQLIESIPTGSISIDYALGVGGMPRGRVIEVFGPLAFLWDRIVARKLAADCEQQTRAFVAAAQERPTEQRA